MDPVTIMMALMALGGVIDIGGKIIGGIQERSQAKKQQDRTEIAGGWSEEALGWEKDQLDWNKEQTDWQKTQIDWANEDIEDQQEDLARKRDADEGTLLTQSAAAGISGPSVNQARGTVLGEYNRAISRYQEDIGNNETRKGWLDDQDSWTDIQKGWVDRKQDWADTQAGWGEEDYLTFLKQSQFNQWMGVADTLLTTGTNMAVTSYNFGLNKPKATPITQMSVNRDLMFSNYKIYGKLNR